LLADLQLKASSDELRGILARVREHAVSHKGPVARETVKRIWREVCDTGLPSCA
jgi:homocitrate synthase NifV